MSGPAATQGSSIPLSARIPRRYRKVGSPHERAPESALVGETPCLLVGDPGAGKTTTLKRLALGLLEGSEGIDQGPFDWPLLVILRELPTSISLVVHLANTMGIRFDSILQKDVVEIDGRKETVERPVNVVGTVPLQEFLVGVMRKSRCLLLVDGLDEVSISWREELERELLELGRHCGEFSIIVSCRSGEAMRTFEGFRLLELCELEASQREDIIRLWAQEHAQGFSELLEKRTYSDLADRPLFLVQLLVIFEQSGFEEIPEQAADVSDRFVELLLNKWDRERGIARLSAYAHFDWHKKAKFLSALAFHLLIKLKQKAFSRKDLETAYASLYQRFCLPEGEGDAVAREIESHSGIIVGSYDHLEFSHLTLQEYLCAEYLVRTPVGSGARTYMREYPAVLAVAVCLAGDPTD